ncbi:Integrase catalytic domain-containing protein [Camponotus japonicus]
MLLPVPAAFRRFASRRGLPSDVYSDNGTNFQGADRELNAVFKRLVADPQIQNAIANDNVKWHFIPPAAPHFGGLWEAGVKAFKHHLKRVVGSRTLSQIEFATLLCQIEACLNSRPILALHDDPNDFSALTPGHFLIGRPLINQPEESTLEINPNCLSRWQQVRAMLEHIWRSWSSDYLHTLQQRSKWQKNQPEIKINELVLLKNNLLPPSKWELARILEIYPGSDNHVRVVTIRTAKTTSKRPITQICRLPIPCDTDS